ncbi:hypothetical protein [Halobacteriovorax sp. ZH2_bin.1]|uniref:hypothetical protein n=1 Tax=Halobacteriovorax sp. ZH2_bin.1 TaxID=3157724 RepID=UPI0037172BEA
MKNNNKVNLFKEHFSGSKEANNAQLEKANSNNVENQKLMKKIEELEKETEQLRQKLEQKGISTKSGKISNSDKIVNAIRSEQINQDTSSPIISKNQLRKKYKVSFVHLDSAISYLMANNRISIKEVRYNAKQKTFQWELMES